MTGSWATRIGCRVLTPKRGVSIKGNGLIDRFDLRVSEAERLGSGRRIRTNDGSDYQLKVGFCVLKLVIGA